MKHVSILLIALILTSFTSCNAASYDITFHLDTRAYTDIQKVEIFGNQKPLSWDKGKLLQDEDGDGIYTIDLKIKSSKSYVKFKFAINGSDELQNSDSRIMKLTSGHKQTFIYNEHEKFNQEEINDIIYSEAQIEEDIEILRSALMHIHPNIYKFRDSSLVVDDFKNLEASIKSKPTIGHAFGEVSKIVSRIKCSHTFTNLWNQGRTVDKALLYQDDKLPLSFTRIGKRIFVDKNASSSAEIKRGLEIRKINGVTADSIMTILSDYVSSDGNNYEKKLERLTLTGNFKFELFDIFFPIVYGSVDSFELELYDLQTLSTVSATVPAMSATKRTMILNERYDEENGNSKSPWSFEIINQDVAVLKLSTFAFFNSDFDWKNYLDKTFKQLNSDQISNLIIDIRQNEGGETRIAKYILERIISEAVEINEMVVSTRYLKIPENLKNYISTWDKFPYDLSDKYREKKNGRYFLKSKYGLPAQTFMPKKDGYKGQVYLITDASNSSATHQMAMYCKMMENVTLVGQETGGNLMGTNGGYIFFLRLPNSKIEIDIPVLGQTLALDEQPRDGGVMPDVIVERHPEDLDTIDDFEMKAILDIIEMNK